MTDDLVTLPSVQRLYLDFDSFFASAEQHFNADLRGRPLGVVPLDSPHTSCIAVSRDAKMRGVKTGASIRMAREVIPDMIFVIARHDAYVRLHKRILDVIGAILPVADVRSIDEVVCHLSPQEAQQGKALADRIKAALAEAFSPALTCSIGMAPTELLAKVGAEMNKPDGFALIDAREMPRYLSHLDLSDLPGISKGIGARLAAAGVQDIDGLWRLAPKQARRIWGNVEGERFWNELHGLHAERLETKKSMYGHSRVLPRDGRTAEKVEACARQLLLSAARRLRRDDLRATELTLGFRGNRDVEAARWSWRMAFPAARDRRKRRIPTRRHRPEPQEAGEDPSRTAANAKRLMRKALALYSAVNILRSRRGVFPQNRREADLRRRSDRTATASRERTFSQKSRSISP